MKFFSIIFFIFFNFSHQKAPRNSSCKEGSQCLTDVVDMLGNLENVKNDLMKTVMFDTLKETFSKLNLPNEFADKIKNEEFLKEAIDSVMKSESKNKQEKSDSKDKTEDKSEGHDHVTNTTKPLAANYKYKPLNGQVNLYDWHDLYHYFPQLASTVRLWKLEFKESARQNWKKFKGCANPGRLVDWLVPDIEEVRNAKRKKKQKSRKERQRDF